MANLVPPPHSLADATALFSEFLSANGYPAQVRRVTAEQFVAGDNAEHYVTAAGADIGLAEATGRYQTGIRRGFGILLQAFCATEDETVAAVYAVKDEADGQFRRIQRGLKLACPTSLKSASPIRDSEKWEPLKAEFQQRFDVMRQAYDL